MPSLSRDPRRSARRTAAPVRLAIALALSLLSSVPAAFAAPATWHIEPLAPCVDQDVRLVFEICTCNTHWLGLTRTETGLVRLDLSIDPDVVCVQCAPDTMGIELGRYAAGAYLQQLEIVSHVLGATDSVLVEQQQAAFTVQPTCGGQIPYLQAVRIGEAVPCEGCLPQVCAGDSIPVFLGGMFPFPCIGVREVRRIPAPYASPLPAPDIIQVIYESCGSQRCAAMLTPWSARLKIGPLPTRSSYNLVVQGFMVDTCVPESLTFLGTRLEPFAVGAACGPPPDSLAHVDHVFIGQGDLPVACAGDSIPVTVQGHFDDDCIRLDEVRLAPNVAPGPGVPAVQVIYRTNSCTTIPCRTGFFPFAGSVRVAPLPSGTYGLAVQEFVRDDCHPGSLVPLGSGQFPFAVTDTCGPPSACFRAAFLHTGACDGYIAKNQAAEATLGLFATSPIGGLQGTLQFDQPGLRVSGVEAVRAGALVSWQPTDTGAKFVILGGASGPLNSPGPSLGEPAPLLTVRVEALPGAAGVPDHARLVPVQLLASDPLGHDVPVCARRPGALEPDPAARFCRATACDFNGDLVTDVRDLVLMLRCMRDTLNACEGIDRSRLDCDADGDRDIDDVLCCARVLLGQGMPDSTGGAPAPGVTLRFGAPAAVTGGIDVPVTLTGANALGAARLAFDYPDAAFESASIGPAHDTPGWLVLDQAAGGHAVFGAIRISPAMPANANLEPIALDLVLHLRSRAGQAPAGSVRYTGGDFSDPNGAALVTAADPVAMPIAGGPRIALGAARPNPFGAETRFSVVLTQDAELDVSVYDLLGRRVATLFRGHAAAGSRDFTWNRTRDDGAAVPSGIYFYRASANGDVAGGKVLVLSRE